MAEMTKPCMVLYDNEQVACVPMGWDTDCDGALCCAGRPVVFPNRAAARRAIRISIAHARLRMAQGRPWNEDFIALIQYVKIVPVVMARADE
jgi:hypothetical protein